MRPANSNMDKKQKRTLIIVGALEAAIIVFCLVVSILVIATYHAPESGPDYAELNAQNGPLIGWFQNNPNPFFLIIVLPLLVILALDIIYLIVFAVRKESRLSDSEREEIAKAAREEAKKELMREMLEEAKKEAETPKE